MQEASFVLEDYMFDYLSLEVSKMVGDTINLDFNVSGEFKQDESKYNLVFVLQAALELRGSCGVTAQRKM